MRTALVHDWLTGMRGGEKVLEQLAYLAPEAPIYTLVHHPGTVSGLIERHPIRTSFVQRLPARAAYRWYLPLFPWAIERFDVGDAELVISSSHCVAKSIRTPPGCIHVCYCHTPMRYAWDQFSAYFSARRNGHITFAIIKAIMLWLRRWDQRTATRVDAFVANSRYVAGRIRRYYGREAAVIPPPVDTERFTPSAGPPQQFWLIVSALSPYKRLEVAIDAFNHSGRPLRIAGWGPEFEALKARAGSNVQLLGKVSDEELVRLYRQSRGLVLPAVEDAGIVQLEAMACGRPALVLSEGGAAESIIEGETGLLIPEATPEAINRTVDMAEGVSFNSQRIRAHAERYSAARFRRRMREFIDRTVRDRGASGPADDLTIAPSAEADA